MVCKSPSKQWEKKQRFSFVEERIAVYIETFKENFFKKFQYEPQKHHLMKYPKYGVKYLFYESWKEYHIKLSNKSTKNGIEQDDNEVINRYGYHEENPLTRQLNPFKQAQKIGNEKYKQRQSRQECSKNLVNPFRQAQQSGQDKFKQQTKQDDVNSVTKGTLTTLTLPLRQQELIPPPKPINNYIDDGESWQEKIKRTGYDPRKDPILKPFIEKLVEEGIEIPGMRGMEIIDDFL
ncbi:4920_t:CDS:2 [Gigaspora rosea]|nr:4920_t:CDS:2 [Gigaspora rosea]